MKAIREFEVKGVERGTRYYVTVKCRGITIDTFEHNSRDEAWQAFRDAGYKPVEKTEGSHIVLQT